MLMLATSYVIIYLHTIKKYTNIYTYILKRNLQEIESCYSIYS